jgi:hypothetical protein
MNVAEVAVVLLSEPAPVPPVTAHKTLKSVLPPPMPMAAS